MIDAGWLMTTLPAYESSAQGFEQIWRLYRVEVFMAVAPDRRLTLPAFSGSHS
jgi:hypothetical protein